MGDEWSEVSLMQGDEWATESSLSMELTGSFLSSCDTWGCDVQKMPHFAGWGDSGRCRLQGVLVLEG